MTLDKPNMIELAWSAGANEIDDCHSLFIEEIGELEELTLDVMIAEAKLQSPITQVNDDDPLGKIKLGSRPIEVDRTCRHFRLLFERNYMVSYTILDECYGKYPKAPEQFTGKLFRVFTTSHLLEFTRETTNASDTWPGPLQHYQLACNNHVLDVIATAPPRIFVGFAVAD
jgi:hypothetical protein